jgi:hypothetical protein
MHHPITIQWDGKALSLPLVLKGVARRIPRSRLPNSQTQRAINLPKHSRSTRP